MRISGVKFLVLIAMSFVGITASSIVFYIYDTLHQLPPWCSSSTTFLGIKINCETVLSSHFNSVYGLNLDILAIAYFMVNLALVFLVAFGSERVFRTSFRILFVWRFLGIVIVPYLLTIEFVVLKAICVYCTIMHVSILVDFVIVTYFLFYKDITQTDQVDEGTDEEASGGPAAPLTS
jgi:uncharacterized membrane protein